MIELKNISKKYNGTYVLKNINLSLPQYGLVVIYGPSGCGKTTLLNIISSLCDFEGDLSFNGKLYKGLSEEDKDNLRNTKIGFIFQDYKLYEFETVKNNILLSLNIKSDEKETLKLRRVLDLLKIVELSHKIDEKVTNLSGGEKQRVAIARAISNSPSLVLADEPTGNLDPKNSKMIMELLLRVSKSSLVVIVSHDEELTRDYADKIVYLEDGEIKDIKYNNHNKHIDRLPLLHIKQKEKRAKLPFVFSLRHIFSSLNRRKWRTLLVLLSTSLSLIGVGLGVILTDLISTNMYKSYSSIIPSNKVIVKSKENNVTDKIYALNETNISKIQDEFASDISYLGVHYLNNFYEILPETYIGLSSGKALPYLTIKHFNEFYRLDEIKSALYPSTLIATDNDEVILGISNSTLVELCLHYQILRTADSLSSYFKKNDIYLNVDVENSSWQYSVSFTLKVKGFVLTDSDCFIHSNARWNEYVFESLCHLPTTNIPFLASKNPWDLRKTFYLEFKRNKEYFLKKMKFDMEKRDLIAEILNQNYYTLRDKKISPKDFNRIMMFSCEQKDNVEGFLGEYISSVSSNISSFTYGSKGSYVMYPENLMMGFARKTYLYLDSEIGEEILGATSYIKYEESTNIKVPDEIVEGHYTKSFSSGLSFNQNYELIKGRKPQNYAEIVVSNMIVNKLKILNPLNKRIFISYPISEDLLPNGYLLRKYQTIKLEIVGISSSNNLEISHENDWPIIFFQDMVGISIFDLCIDNISLDVNENGQDEVIHNVNRAFPTLEATCPISSVKDSVESVCNYIEIILLILSISSILISALLLSMCNLLHYSEIKKDIGLARCLGISKKESAKFIYYHSFSLAILSYLIASIEVIAISIFLNQSMGEIFMIDTNFYFNPMAFIYMLLLSLSIALISSIALKKKIKKLNPLDCLR